ncbi:hypothetical protein KRR23_25925 [Pseudomonas sp. CVAP|uniref:hypothetical protein n=1 Tax=Pseudomonas sp. CVAP\|nr:hypothetical protein [Pseudomonas sp. CVAP\
MPRRTVFSMFGLFALLALTANTCIAMTLEEQFWGMSTCNIQDVYLDQNTQQPVGFGDLLRSRQSVTSLLRAMDPQ